MSSVPDPAAGDPPVAPATAATAQTATAAAAAEEENGTVAVLSRTESVCPRCLRRLPAERLVRGPDVYLRRTCPEHGTFRTIVWRGEPSHRTWRRPKIPAAPERPATAVSRGCPFDCGLCPDHRQATCCVLIELTRRCDLHCPVCFADAGGRAVGGPGADPPLGTVREWLRRLAETAGPVNVQLSGGEPTVRDDLPEIIRAGRDLGFGYLQLNTNGLRLARDPDYLHRLVTAGLSTVFLQFDSLDETANRRLRGRAVAAHKREAVRRCAQEGVGVVLVPTLIPGVNVDDLGPLLDYALAQVPTVRGMHVQPVSYFGRYPGPPGDADRLTLPEAMRALVRAGRGRIPLSAFSPPGAEHTWCSFHAHFVVQPEGTLTPLTRNPAAGGCCQSPVPARQGAVRQRVTVARRWSGPGPGPEAGSDPETGPGTGCGGSGAGLGGWDTLLERARTHGFSLSGMGFQDAWNLDLERLRDCCVHTLAPDGRLIPFCAHNLTDAAGRPLYRQAAGPDGTDRSGNPPNPDDPGSPRCR